MTLTTEEAANLAFAILEPIAIIFFWAAVLYWVLVVRLLLEDWPKATMVLIITSTIWQLLRYSL